MRGTTLEERMAGNSQDRAIAFQAAEAGLRWGEDNLVHPSSPLVFDGCDNGPYYVTTNNTGGTCTPDQPRWKALFGAAIGSPGINVLSLPPTGQSDLGPATAHYFIEKLQSVVLPGTSLGQNQQGSRKRVYRVTAEGNGRSGGTAVVLQSTFIK
jgi:type IV pilus assembly protein PilX